MLGVGVVVAHLTLTQVVQVRFLYPLPYKNTLSFVSLAQGLGQGNNSVFLYGMRGYNLVVK